jgi:two-component system, sensor histidine kinase and response regulator
MIGTLITIGYIIFSNWKLSSDSIIKKAENDANKDIYNEIEALVNIPLYTNEINHNLFQNGLVDIYNKKSREAFFAGVIKASGKEIYSFSYGMENGEYYGARRNMDNDIEIYRSNAETNGHSCYYSVTEDLTEDEFIKDFGKFDPRTRDWYRIAKEKGKPVFSPLYKHFVKNDLALSAAYPIYSKDGVLKGVLGTHITLERLNRYLKEIIQDRIGTAYIIEKDSGEVVANSLDRPNFSTGVEGKVKRIKIEQIENESIKEAYEGYKKTSNSSFRIKAGKDKLHIKLSEYKREGLSWLIITVIPESIFTAEISNNIRTAIVLSIIALLLSMIIYMKITEVILKPIRHLISAAERFSKGDLSQRARIFKNDEIGKLSSAFNIMAEELYIYINKLEEKVKERTRELEKANTDLRYAKIEAEKANEAKSEFIANMSHEIRTPLNAVIGFSELLQTAEIDEKHKNYIKTIHIAGNSLLTIINDILDLSKIEAGKIELQHKPVKLINIFQEIENIFREKVKSKGIEFILDIQEGFPHSILFDEVRIRQVLLNLVGNAVKFTEKGYVKLSLSAEVSTSNLSSLDLRISVEDTGIGIPEGDKEKILEPFIQISGQNTKKFGGTGLGLSITKKLTEMMNGKIFIESSIDKGSIFHVEFYNVYIAATEALPEDTVLSYSEKYNFSNEKILVVDDSESNRFLLKELLLKAEINVITAENGNEALRICQWERPALIITDLVMPEMDGFQLSSKLKEQPELCSIPVIVLSASATPVVLKDSRFDDYLMKPVNADQLLNKISQYINNRRIKEHYVSSKTDTGNVNSTALEPEVLIDLRNEVGPLIEKLETSIIIGSIKNLAEILISFGQQHRLELIFMEGKELMRVAESYNIIKIRLKLDRIKKLILGDNQDERYEQ